MTRTIGLVAAIAACCLHLGAPTAAETKTKGNGGSDPDTLGTRILVGHGARENVFSSL